MNAIIKESRSAIIGSITLDLLIMLLKISNLKRTDIIIFIAHNITERWVSNEEIYCFIFNFF